MDNICREYNCSPKLVKTNEVKESIFGNRVIPIFKKLNELDIMDYEEYDDVNKVYIYCPHHADSDKNGIKTFTPIGATYKKRNKRLYIVASEDGKNGRHELILVSDNGNESKTFFAGNLISHDAWQKVKEGEEYIGYRSSKWIKKSVSDISKFCGKILETEL